MYIILYLKRNYRFTIREDKKIEHKCKWCTYMQLCIHIYFYFDPRTYSKVHGM